MGGRGRSGGRRALVLVGSTIGWLLAICAPSLAADYSFTRVQADPMSIPMVGKLRLVNDGKAESCSGAVVDTANRSVVLTAGHCTYGSVQGYPESGEFTPAYSSGQAPFSTWPVQAYFVGDPWVLSGHSHFDFAFLVMGRNDNGRTIEDVVGGLPIAFNQVRDQSYRVLGYPGEPNPPFDGELLWECDTQWGSDFRDPDPDEQYGPSGMVVGCDMGHGASGGPWVNAQGQISSLTSTTFSGRPDVLGGPYLGDDAAAKFAQAAAVSDAATCKGLAVTQLGGKGPDRFRGTSGDDVISTGAGNDVVVAGAGNDTICGGGGADRINGGPGRDNCQGGPGRNRLKSCP